MTELVALSLAAAIFVAADLLITYLRKKAHWPDQRHSASDGSKAKDGPIHEGRNQSH
jgi:hypothetical protein